MKSLTKAIMLPAALALMSACQQFQIPGERERQLHTWSLAHGGPHDNLRLTSVDFSQNTGWNMVCTGQPLQYSNVKIFTPQISLNQPAPSEITLYFWVKSHRSFWPDPELGYFAVTWDQGQTTPNKIMAPITAAAGATGKTPAGAPADGIEDQGFWLGCTGGCKVRGSEGRNNDEDAEVYLQRFSASVVPEIGGERKSPRHRVTCQ